MCLIGVHVDRSRQSEGLSDLIVENTSGCSRIESGSSGCDRSVGRRSGDGRREGRRNEGS